jgi:hypothetical protein
MAKFISNQFDALMPGFVHTKIILFRKLKLEKYSSSKPIDSILENKVRHSHPLVVLCIV